MTNKDTRAALTGAVIEKGWYSTFSTSNPYCPCNLKSFTKAVRWAEHALAGAAADGVTRAVPEWAQMHAQYAHDVLHNVRAMLSDKDTAWIDVGVAMTGLRNLYPAATATPTPEPLNAIYDDQRERMEIAQKQYELGIRTAMLRDAVIEECAQVAANAAVRYKEIHQSAEMYAADAVARKIRDRRGPK
jgi:hypothetical protein